MGVAESARVEGARVEGARVEGARVEGAGGAGGNEFEGAEAKGGRKLKEGRVKPHQFRPTDPVPQHWTISYRCFMDRLEAGKSLGEWTFKEKRTSVTHTASRSDITWGS